MGKGADLHYLKSLKAKQMPIIFHHIHKHYLIVDNIIRFLSLHWLYSPNSKEDCFKTNFKSYFPFLYFHSVTLNASLRPPMPPPTITQQLHTELPRTDFHLNSINFENFMQKLNLKISPPDLHRGDGCVVLQFLLLLWTKL